MRLVVRFCKCSNPRDDSRMPMDLHAGGDEVVKASLSQRWAVYLEYVVKLTGSSSRYSSILN
jgi:hypothetical protein